MWTTIKREDYNKYLNQYPDLAESPDTFILNENDKGNIILPYRFIETHPSNLLTTWNDHIDPLPIKFDFKFDLRKEQAKIIEIVKKIYKDKGSVRGIIKARPGAGKTVLSIYISMLLGLKTLIIVDKEQLMGQWIAEIIETTSLTEDDIGIIKGSIFTSTTKPITIATVQTLLSKIKNNVGSIYNKIAQQQYGLVIYDEVHKSSASEQFGKVSILFTAKNIIGLSATPYKYKEQDILMKNIIGELIYDGKDYDIIPDLYMIKYESGLEKYRGMFAKLQDLTTRLMMINKLISGSKKFIDLVIKYTKKDLADNRRIMILCFSEKQILTISEALTKENIEHRLYYGKEHSVLDKQNDKVLVVTYAYCGTGFNYTQLSSLIVVCPISGRVSLIQSTGRILRSAEGKDSAVVRYFVDMSLPSMFLPISNKVIKVFDEEFKAPVHTIDETGKDLNKEDNIYE